MTSQAADTASVAGIDRALTRSFLLNVADAIGNVLQPELSGSAQARAGECVTILTRIAQTMAPADEALAGALEQLSQSIARQADAPTLAILEGRALDLIEAQTEAAGAAADANGTSSSRNFDQTKFERYLQSHPLGGADLRLSQCKQLPGGRSKQTILVSQQGGKDLPADIVVRQDWASAVTGTSVVAEFELLKRVFEAGLRVPQPLLLERSADIMGAPFMVVTRVGGGPQGDIFNPPPSEALALQIAEQLARLHTLPVADFSRIGVPCDAYTEEQLRNGLEGFRQLNAKLGTGARTIDAAIEWLAANLDQVDGPQALVHNDLGCHNFLIDGEQLTAILDWELAQIGNPAADLGYIRGWIRKMTAWPTFMAAYEGAGGPRLTAITVDFYTIWCGVRLYCLLLQARAGVLMGAVRDTEITYAVAEFVPTLLHRISQELREILGASVVA